MRSPSNTRITITIRDSDELGAAVRLAALLGAGYIADGLRPGREKGMLKLARRMRLLLTRVVGEGVTVGAEAGCVHDEDTLSVDLSPAQAVVLADRVTAAPTGPDSAPPTEPA